MPEKNGNHIEDIPESYQEYLETIYRLSLNCKDPEDKCVSNIGIAQYMNIKPSSVTNMLRKLADKNLIKWKPRKKDIKLTTKGNKIARKLLFNHLLLEIFLFNLGIKDPNISHKYACELEHHLDDTIFKAFKKIIGKKGVELIENYLNNEKDPDLIILRDENLKNLNIFNSPEEIINNFSEFLIKKIPTHKKILIEEKEKYLKTNIE